MAGWLHGRYLGCIAYDAALHLQRQLATQLAADATGSHAGTVLFCQHPAVYTVGRRHARSATPYADEARLRGLGTAFHAVDRGGDITFHGPGQLVGYPVVNLRRVGLGARRYICALENGLIAACVAMGVAGHRAKDTGVWVDGVRKVAAIGVHVSRGITMHGFALNCDIDLTWFDHIVPCGLAGKQATSLTRERQCPISVDDALPVVVGCLGDALGLEIVMDAW